MSIQSLGIGSGLLTTDLVDQLVKAERAATDMRLGVSEKRVEAQISAYGNLKSSIDKLQLNASRLANSQGIQRATAKSSNESALTATTNNLAEDGSYSINIQQTAQAHTLASKQFASPTSTLGTGIVTINFGTLSYDGDGKPSGLAANSKKPSIELDFNSQNNSLSGVRDTINRANLGVRASLVNDGGGYRLLLSSSETGKDMAMTIDVVGDSGLQALAYNPLSSDPEQHMKQTQFGQDAELTINGLAITSSKNQLDEVIRGVTLNLNQVSTGPINLSLERDVKGVVEQVGNFVEAYNEYRELYQSLVRFDPGAEVGGLLMGDANLRTINNQVRSMLGSMVEGLQDSRLRTLADIGISTDRNNSFNLKLDSGRLEQALRSDPRNVSGLLASNLNADNASNVTVVSKSADTKPGNYDVEITQVAEQARWQGQKTDKLSFAEPLVIDGANNNFRINVDGRTANVSLTQGSYASGEDLALMIQSSINQSFTTGPSVSVLFDSNEQALSLTSSRFGAVSEVAILSTSPSVGSTLGLVPPGVGGLQGNTLSFLAEQSFAASTSPGNQEIRPEMGLNFAANQMNFTLSLAGNSDPSKNTDYTIVLDQDISNVLDVNGNVTTARDREDVLAYIQGELNAAGLAGAVTASFNSSNRLQFSTTEDSGLQTLTIADLTLGGTNLLGLQEQTVDSGLTLGSNTSFKLDIANRLGNASSETITVAAGTYQTPDELAQAIETAINADANIQGTASGALSAMGTRVLAGNVDFSTRPSSLEFNFNGADFNIDIASNAGSSTLESIQAALDAELGAGIIEARIMPGMGLQLATVATGKDQQLTILGSGRGSSSFADDGSTSINGAAFDFSADPATLELLVDGISINVEVNADTTVTGQTNLEAVQEALDRALVNADGGGKFIAGDVIARLETFASGDKLVFETRSRMGQETATTFGAGASIQVVSVGATDGNDALGLVAGGSMTSGADGFGLPTGYFQGFDGQSSVSFTRDEQGNGQFSMLFDNETSVFIKDPSVTAMTQLGWSVTTETSFGPSRGKDVAGTINGVAGNGRGQFLTAGAGNQAASNGFVLGGEAWNFSFGPVVIDNNNRSMSLEVDGVSTGDINVPQGVYASGNLLAQALQTAINNNANLQSANKSVNVQFDTSAGVFGIFSTTRGLDSNVKVAGISAGATDVFGLTTGTASVRGKAPSGAVNPAAGLMLRIDGEQTGKRGQVNYIRGIADELSTLLEGILKRDGLLSQRTASLEKEQEQVVEQRSELDRRMEVFRARLASQFSFNDRIISRLKTTEDFLVQQFDIMAAGMSNKRR